MTDLYDQRIDEMKAQEYLRDHFCWPPARYIPKQWVQNVRNHERLAAYKRKRAMVEIQRLGQEMDNG